MSRSTERVRALARAASALAVLALAVSAPREAWSNGPEVGVDAGTIYPVESWAIQLVSEEVEVWPGRMPTGDSDSSGNAHCLYRLRNLTDSTQRVTMAFVTNSPMSPELPESWQALYRTAGFLVWQDGRYLPVRFCPVRQDAFRREYGAEADSFPTWDLTVGPLATSTVRMHYTALWSGGGEGENAHQDFTYYARPAARWAGRIEKAVFRLHLGDSTLVRRLQRTDAPWRVRISPGSQQWTADGLRWEFRDWEPDTDLSVSVSYNEGDPAWSPWTPDSLAAMPSITRGLDRQPKIAARPVCDDPRRWMNPHVGYPATVVRLRVHVDASGRVDQVRRPEGPLSFQEVAVHCVWGWRFHPALRHGQPVAAWRDVTVAYPAIPRRE